MQKGAKMDKDVIYRQDAIDALCDNCDNVQAVCPHYPCKQYIAIENLPPAQAEQTIHKTEIIRPKSLGFDVIGGWR